MSLLEWPTHSNYLLTILEHTVAHLGAKREILDQIHQRNMIDMDNNITNIKEFYLLLLSRHVDFPLPTKSQGDSKKSFTPVVSPCYNASKIASRMKN